jgi:L,D-transpeptidase ErfK/SrfK
MRNPLTVNARAVGHVALCGVLLGSLSGCAFLLPVEPSTEQAVAAPEPPAAPNPAAPRLTPLDTRHFTLASADQDMVGETQVLFSRYEDTFSAIGREYNLGFEELRRANPDVDEWVPGTDTPIYLPTQVILPNAPRQGIVVNVPTMRLYYFTSEKDPADPAAKVMRVTSHPIGVGAEGWATPVGEAKVTQKARDPVWYPPASVRKEHAERGDPLPSVVPAGPDNPLGRHAMALSIPGYLIHGTNKPAGVGMRSSHGCIRLYPEDIEELFDRVPKGASVTLVNQPVLAAWHGDNLYLEVHPPLVEDTRDLAAEAEQVLAAALERAKRTGTVAIDPEIVRQVITEQRGIPFPVLRAAKAPLQYLAASRIVENTTPAKPAEQTAQNEPAATASAAR